MDRAVRIGHSVRCIRAGGGSRYPLSRSGERRKAADRPHLVGCPSADAHADRTRHPLGAPVPVLPCSAPPPRSELRGHRSDSRSPGRLPRGARGSLRGRLLRLPLDRPPSEPRAPAGPAPGPTTRPSSATAATQRPASPTSAPANTTRTADDSSASTPCWTPPTLSPSTATPTPTTTPSPTATPPACGLTTEAATTSHAAKAPPVPAARPWRTCGKKNGPRRLPLHLRPKRNDELRQ